MRRVFIGATVFALLVFAGSGLLAGDYDKWFDLENCGMCKPLAAHEGLLQNVKWEHYPISNGMVSVTTVRSGFETAYDQAYKKMMAVHKRMEAGEKIQLCNSCIAMSALFDETVSREMVKTSNGNIQLIISSNQEKVAKLHEWTARTTEEMAKMAKMASHEGHGH